MSTIVYDRAVETIGVSHRDAMADLGIEVIYAGAAQPQAKGVIERLFRTLNDLVFHRLSGSVQLSASLMREMGYDPAKTAVLTLEELELLLEEAINVYHYEVHAGLGVSPIHYWTERATSISTLPDVSVLDKMMGIVYHRTLDRAGIRIFNLSYCCEKNVPLLLNDIAARERTKRGKRKGSVTAVVKVKVNPDDIRTIQVFNPADNEYYELKCCDPDYAAGTSLWQHQMIRKYAKARGDAFRTPEQRRELRMSLTRSIEEACPEIGLKAKRARKKLEDAFQADDRTDEGDDTAYEDVISEYGAIPIALAAHDRADKGTPQHSPQRGKTARRKNSGRTTKTQKGQVGQVGQDAVLMVITDEQLAVAAKSWPMQLGV